MLKHLTVRITTNWKILQEIGIPDHLTFIQRNLYASQEATVRTGHGTMDWFKIGKRSTSRLYIVSRLIYLICRVHHAKCQAGWGTSWNQDFQEKYQYPQICICYYSYGRMWRGTKEPLDESERGKWKAGLKLNIQKTKIMVSSPMTSWQIEEEKVEAGRFYFLGL